MREVGAVQASAHSAPTDASVAAERRERPAGRYRPALDEYARTLIARIQNNHRDEEAVHALADHYARHGDYPSLANLMEGWAEMIVRDHAAADAYLEAADAVLAGLSDRERARRLYEKALARDPNHAVALERLEGLLRELGDYAGLERTLSQLASALIGEQVDADRRAHVHFRLGQLYENHLALPGKAIAQYRQALTLDRTLVPAIVAAREIYGRARKQAAVAHMYELEIAALEGARDKCLRLVELAQLRTDKLDDLDGAVVALRRALKVSPGDVQALDQLARVLSLRGTRATDESAQQDRWRAAELNYQIARSVPRGHAKRYLRACLEVHPGHARAVRMLEELTGYSTLSPEDFEPAEAQASQAELDARITGRFLAIDDGPARADNESSLQWLNDELREEPAPGPERMAPVTDRPPPPPTGAALPAFTAPKR